MKFLITGGAGFIGSNLANELSKKHEVFVLDNLSTGKKENLNKNIKLIKGSVTDYKTLEKSTKGVDYVFHLAALVALERSIKNPGETFNVNTLATFYVLKASLKNKVKKVIFASSAAVYGNSPKLPNNEEIKPEPLTPYGFSKLNSEYLCKSFLHLGLKTSCLRFFNVYGPNQNLNSEYSAVIPIFISNALNNKDIKLDNSGKQTRDFVFVKDIVNACITVMEKGNGIYNVCSSKEISIKELAETIKELTGASSDLINSPSRIGDIEKSVGDNCLLKKLGWKPETKLKSGLMKTIEWFKKIK